MNHSLYEHTRYFAPGGIPYHMDTVHIDVLHALALACPEGSVITEIGSFKGSSTSAWLEAMKTRQDIKLHIIETKPLPELQRMVEESTGRNRITMHDYPSDQSLVPSRIVLIDGDHGMQAYADLCKALLTGCEVIIIHDSQTHVKTEIPACEGAHGAARMLRDCPTRNVWEDSEYRTGLHTERGLLVSWPRTDRKDWVAETLNQIKL